ncbi:MAG: hypothetical protein AAFO94_02165, partial [Bacteroidota bacterium]
MKNPLAGISPRNTQDASAAVEFVQQAQLAGKDWQRFKTLFKQNTTAANASLFVALLHKLETATANHSQSANSPTKATLNYLRRRAIRSLKHLAKADPEQYVIVVLSFLKLQKCLSPNHWISQHILKGQSRRVQQSRHGRGAWLPQNERANVTRREEPVPELWDNNVKLVEALLFVDGLDAQVYEFAVKVLLRNKRTLPVFPRHQLLCFYRSASPWLQYVASQQCVDAMEKGIHVDAWLMAHTWLYSTTAVQQRFSQYLARPQLVEGNKGGLLQRLQNVFTNEASKSGRLRDEFINFLAQLVFAQPASALANRRMRNGLRQLQKSCNSIQLTKVSRYLPNMLKSENIEMAELAFHFIARMDFNAVQQLMTRLEAVPASVAKMLYEMTARRFTGKVNNEKFINESIDSQDFYVAELGWYLLSQRNQQDKISTRFFYRHTYRGWRSAPFRHAVCSAIASELLLPGFNTHNYYWKNRPGVVVKIYQHGSPAMKALMEEQIHKCSSYQFYAYLNLLQSFDNRDALANAMYANTTFWKNQLPVVINLLTAQSRWIQSWGTRVLTGQLSNKAAISQLYGLL